MEMPNKWNNWLHFALNGLMSECSGPELRGKNFFGIGWCFAWAINRHKKKKNCLRGNGKTLDTTWAQ